MFNWNVIEKTYIYDGSFDGLLTMVFNCYTKKVIPSKILNKNTLEPNFLDCLEEQETDFEKSKRIFNGIVKNISYSTLYYSYYSFLSNEKDKEINILKYLLYGFAVGPKINTMLSYDFVFAVHAMKKKVFGESHRLKRITSFYRN